MLVDSFSNALIGIVDSGRWDCVVRGVTNRRKLTQRARSAQRAGSELQAPLFPALAEKGWAALFKGEHASPVPVGADCAAPTGLKQNNWKNVLTPYTQGSRPGLKCAAPTGLLDRLCGRSGSCGAWRWRRGWEEISVCDLLIQVTDGVFAAGAPIPLLSGRLLWLNPGGVGR